jgi:hypothetical protein
MKLTGTSPYLHKDQKKSDHATCFIGRGSERSSSNSYRKCWGELANKGSYTSDDIVFVSAEGMRGGRIAPDLEEIRKACEAGAMFLTDDSTNRARPYNIGEREVAEFLRSQNYAEAAPGLWAHT